MANELVQSAADVLLAPKSAGVVAAGTMTAGVVERFKLVPWGDIAAFVGVVLTLVLIFTHIARYMLDRKRALLEIRILRAEVAGIDRRKEKRTPTNGDHNKD